LAQKRDLDFLAKTFLWTDKHLKNTRKVLPNVVECHERVFQERYRMHVSFFFGIGHTTFDIGTSAEYVAAAAVRGSSCRKVMLSAMIKCYCNTLYFERISDKHLYHLESTSGPFRVHLRTTFDLLRTFVYEEDRFFNSRKVSSKIGHLQTI